MKLRKIAYNYHAEGTRNHELVVNVGEVSEEIGYEGWDMYFRRQEDGKIWVIIDLEDTYFCFTVNKKNELYVDEFVYGGRDEDDGEDCDTLQSHELALVDKYSTIARELFYAETIPSFETILAKLQSNWSRTKAANPR